jgi:hypothetical protein
LRRTGGTLMASDTKVEQMVFLTAGYSICERLNVYPRRKVLKVNPQTGAKCGIIEDGVVFEHDNDGKWVLSFSDLEKIYLRAKELKDEAEQKASTI